MLQISKKSYKKKLSECVHSYGENCQYSCSEHCINQTMDRFNGVQGMQ